MEPIQVDILKCLESDLPRSEAEPYHQSNPNPNPNPNQNPNPNPNANPNQKTKPQVLVAYSGGLDSSVLLHACQQLLLAGYLGSLRAVHADHGIQKESQDWAQFCELTCRNFEIDLIVERFELAIIGDTSEAKARKERYRLFEKLLEPNEVLLTAHHNDDQVETLLFRLFRGAGINGLKGMPVSRKVGVGILRRPLLEITRKDLEAYANRFDLAWVDDPSNKEVDYSRNFIRNKIIPLISEKWPSINRTLSQFSKHAQEQTEILNEVAEQDLSLKQNNTSSIDCEALSKLSLARQKNALHFWARSNSQLSPASNEIDQLINQLDAAKKQSIKVKLAGGWVQSYKSKLFFCNAEQTEAILEPIVWKDLTKTLRLDGGISITMTKKTNANLPESQMSKSETSNYFFAVKPPKPTDIVTIKAREGGEVVRPSYREKSTSLKNIYQELEIPPWQRLGLPLVYYNDQLVTAVGAFVSADFIDPNGIYFQISYTE